jgi:hypothetical protein
MAAINLRKLALSVGACLAIAGPLVAWRMVAWHQVGPVDESISRAFYGGASERNHKRIALDVDFNELSKRCSSEADVEGKTREKLLRDTQSEITFPLETRLEKERQRRAMRGMLVPGLKEEPLEEFEKREREFDKQQEERVVAQVRDWRDGLYNNCARKSYEKAYAHNPPSNLDFIAGGGVSSVIWLIWYLVLPAFIAFCFGYGAVAVGPRIARRYINWLTN